ncbi:fumarylacetoacetate hydrolase family protein [Salinibacterium sp. GXW1014]|uniref:fumarylacetoacetate hydrolase family protein n=1 Tax=Salinibacterium sp. GXW1014 TaxID=3377838 RepID=UPI00383AF96F
MKLASLRTDAGIVAAAVVDDEVVDLSVAAPELPNDAVAILISGEAGAEAVARAIASGKGRRPLNLSELESPVQNPQKFIAVGRNYLEHVKEIGEELPKDPTVFSKWNNTIAAPYADVQVPAVSDRLDFECELGVVIGRRARHVSEANAPLVIAGYVCINDYSVRDYQMMGGQWVLGKSFDGHGVVGPWIVTPDELDPHNLPIRTIVNGETRQSSNTKNLIFTVERLIAHLSGAMTLEPGDLIATGTPGGVGVMENRYLAAGDLVRVEIDGIGAIENRIVAEPTPVEFIGEPAAL